MSNPYFDPKKAEKELEDIAKRRERIETLRARREAQLVKRGLVPPRKPVPENASLYEKLNICSKELSERGPVLAKDKLYHALDRELDTLAGVAGRIAQSLILHRIEQENYSDIWDKRVCSAS
jgi:hypothetical protein